MSFRLLNIHLSFLSLYFDDIDNTNTPIAKRTHVLSAFEHTFVLFPPYFDDIDNTTVHSDFPSLALQYLNSSTLLMSLMALRSH